MSLLSNKLTGYVVYIEKKQALDKCESSYGHLGSKTLAGLNINRADFADIQ